MENLPTIQATLDEWLQLTIAQPLYAAAIVITVFILTALLYGIKNAGLRKQNTVSETARANAENNLNIAQQQLQQAQSELTTASEQLDQQQKAADAEKQRANSAEEQLAQRNQQIIALVQRLAISFDIGEAPIQVVKNLTAEDLWQQHDKVITKLTHILSTETQAKTELQKFYQAEKDKLATAESRLQSLQASLDSQISLVSTLQSQNSSLQELHSTTQQTFAEATQKLARLAHLEQRVPGLERQLSQLTGKAVQAVETTVEIVQTAATVTAEKIDDSADKLKNLFAKPQPQPVQEAIVPELQQTAQPEPIVTDILVTPLNDVPAETEATIDNVSEQKQSGSLLSGLFRKAAGKGDSEPTPETVVEEETPGKASGTSAIKGFYQKFTSKSEVIAEPVVEQNPVAVEETSEKTGGTSALKGFYQKFTNKSEVEAEPVIEPAPVVIVEDTVEIVSDISVLNKPEPVVEPEPAVVKPTPEKANIRRPVPPRIIKEQEIKLSDKEPSTRIEDLADKITDSVEGVKNLYGKFFSKNK